MFIIEKKLETTENQKEVLNTIKSDLHRITINILVYSLSNL